MRLGPLHDDATIDEAVAALARELGGYLIAADAGLGSVPLEVCVTRRWRDRDSNHRSRSCERFFWAVRGSIEAQRRNGLLLTRRWREPDSNHRSRSCEGSSGRCQSETAARKAEALTGSGPRRRCLPGAAPRRLSLRGGTARSNPSSSREESAANLLLPRLRAGWFSHVTRQRLFSSTRLAYSHPRG